MKWFVKVMDRINAVLKFVIVLMLVVAFIALILQVLSRFVFRFPLTWSEELSRYLLIWITFIGASLAMRYQRLIRIEAAVNLLPEKLRKAVLAVAGLAVVVFCAIVFRYSLDLLQVVSRQSSPSLHLSMSIPYLAIPTGCVLIILNTIAGFFSPREGE
jgi:TRAP-type C4-dicarboxylate transport system permease small subunit